TGHLLLRGRDDVAQIGCGHNAGAAVCSSVALLAYRSEPDQTARREDRSACSVTREHEIRFDVVLRDVPHDPRCRSSLLTKRTIDGENLLTVDYAWLRRLLAAERYRPHRCRRHRIDP